MTIITYVQMLGAMSAWLDKAAIEAAGKGGDAILEAGLIDDMFPLSAQVRIACDEATAKVKRLTTKSLVPSHDNETMIAFLIEQIVTDAGYEVAGPSVGWRERLRSQHRNRCPEPCSTSILQET